ncbi:hypothetical protein GUJ93_ZPchr0013g35820 [Zizania palustris]|uniref:Uncharacterized protein n=1 Tax=Zizania palustris TaxID=103762 RepID=A0A8J6BXA7_ZIZPA|nr:hypothetical protein GUJ93_ZPchr0013g35820 [Zizania palustris]
MQAIMRHLDNLDEKLQPLQPLQEKVAMLEESQIAPWAHFLSARSTINNNISSCNDHNAISSSIVYRFSEHQIND